MTIPQGVKPLSTLGNESGPPVERRKSERYACVLEVGWAEAGRTVFSPGLRARVLNVGRDGAGLQVQEQYPEGAALTADLYGAGNRSYLGQFAFRVARANLQSDGTWALGVTFPAPLSAEQVLGLLA